MRRRASSSRRARLLTQLRHPPQPHVGLPRLQRGDRRPVRAVLELRRGDAAGSLRHRQHVMSQGLTLRIALLLTVPPLLWAGQRRGRPGAGGQRAAAGAQRHALESGAADAAAAGLARVPRSACHHRTLAAPGAAGAAGRGQLQRAAVPGGADQHAAERHADRRELAGVDAARGPGVLRRAAQPARQMAGAVLSLLGVLLVHLARQHARRCCRCAWCRATSTSCSPSRCGPATAGCSRARRRRCAAGRVPTGTGPSSCWCRWCSARAWRCSRRAWSRPCSRRRSAGRRGWCLR